MPRRRAIEDEITSGYRRLARDPKCPYVLRMFALNVLAVKEKMVDIQLVLPGTKLKSPPVMTAEEEKEVPNVPEELDAEAAATIASWKK